MAISPQLHATVVEKPALSRQTALDRQDGASAKLLLGSYAAALISPTLSGIGASARVPATKAEAISR